MPCEISAYGVGASMVINQQPTLGQPASLALLAQTANSLGWRAGESQASDHRRQIK